MQNKTNKTQKKNVPNQQKVHHYVRTIIAGLFGTLALSLILASILLVWLNRTLTDTPTYVRTVAPLASKPDVQKYLADQVTDTLLKNNNVDDIASKILTPAEIAGKTPEQLKSTVRSVVHDSVAHVVQSPEFAKLWRDTNERSHQAFVAQLKGDSDYVTLDLAPVVNGLTDELKQTRLAPVVDKMSLENDKEARFNLKGGAIDKAHKLYGWLQKGTLLVLLVTCLSAGLAIAISVHHKKTARRILLGTGIIALILAALLRAVSIVQPKGVDEIQRRAAVAFAGTLFHNLQLACLILGVVCVVLAVASKVYNHTQHKN